MLKEDCKYLLKTRDNNIIMKSNISTVAMLAVLMVTGSDRRMQFLPLFIALPGVQDPHCCFSEAPKKHLCAFLWREQVSFS